MTAILTQKHAAVILIALLADIISCEPREKKDGCAASCRQNNKIHFDLIECLRTHCTHSSGRDDGNDETDENKPYFSENNADDLLESFEKIYTPASSSFHSTAKSDSNDDVTKRTYSHYVRIGKSSPSEYVRIGKAQPYGYVRIGKAQPYGYVRIGKAHPRGFVRIGKASPYGYVRIGRASPYGYVRIGKASPYGYVRIGKAQPYGYVRIGKAQPYGYVRIGKSLHNTGL